MKAGLTLSESAVVGVGQEGQSGVLRCPEKSVVPNCWLAFCVVSDLQYAETQLLEGFDVENEAYFAEKYRTSGSASAVRTSLLRPATR